MRSDISTIKLSRPSFIFIERRCTPKSALPRSLFDRRSHLFITTIVSGLCSAISAASTLSTRCNLKSADAACSNARRTPSRSITSSLSRIPAVSIMTAAYPLKSMGTSITSRVVPAISETIATSLFAKAFNKLDLPTFGAPVKAIRKPSRIRSPILLSDKCSLIS